MAGSADANLLIAVVDPSDALHQRAVRHVAKAGRLRASVPAVLEAFAILHRRGVHHQSLLAHLRRQFDIEEESTLFSAALALDEGLVKTPFDAYHVADARARGEALHTADSGLLKSPFPTAPY